MSESEFNLEKNIPSGKTIDTESLDQTDGKRYVEYGELTAEEMEKMKVLDEQFNRPEYIEIPMPGNERENIKIEYVVLDVRDQNELKHAQEINEKTAIHVPGYGTSFRGPENFVKLMAMREKKRVIVISQPSTGYSDDPPASWRKEKDFHLFADVIHNTLQSLRDKEARAGNNLTTEQISLVSSSLGSVIAAEMAAKYQNEVSDLIMFAPAGMEKGLFVGKGPVSKKGLGTRYIPQAIGGKNYPRKALEETGDKDYLFYQQVQDTIGDDVKINLNNTQRKLWRLWEAKILARGYMPELLKKIKAKTLVISGGKDTLFPAGENEYVKENLINAKKVETKVYAESSHYDIYWLIQNYTTAAGEFIDKNRQEELKENNEKSLEKT